MKKIIPIIILSFLLLPSSFVLAEVIIRGPYSNPLELTGMIAKQKVDNWGPRYKKDDNKKEYYLKINDQEYGPFVYIGASIITEKWWGFEYQDNSGAYTNVNGKIYGPYETTYGLCVSGSNWGFKYSKNKKAFVLINGKQYGPYDFANVSVSDKIWVYNYWEDGKVFVNSMDRIYGPYDRNFVTPKTIGNNWKIDYSFSGILSYLFKDKMYTIVNGVKFGPYKDMKVLLGDDAWVVNYKKDGNWYAILSSDNINNDFSELNKHNFITIFLSSLVLISIAAVPLFFIMKRKFLKKS